MSLRTPISFHPKLAAALDLLFGLVLIWWVGRIGTLWLFGIWWLFRAVWWFALVECMYYPPFLSRLRHWATLAVFNLGALFFIIFVDSALARYLVKGIILLVPLVSFLLIPEHADQLSMFAKPERRWRFLMSVFALAGFWSGAFALSAFGVADTNFLRLSVGLTAAVVTVAVSWWWWREYGLSYGKNFWFSSGVLGLVIFEISYCVALWPLGYLVSGLVVVWLWYLLWLLLRFSQTAEGINWRRQRFFLSANALLFTLFLIFIARWK
ncbi:MAG: hypothetical protein HY983_02370 [Candidatus Magasanikbacteria bacterium]|nr:hypothetical protein [Candidatus Magasanikbacteria bacterium]